MELAERISGQELSWFFNMYLRQPELPVLLSSIGGEKLVLEWKTPEGFPFPMPLGDSSGRGGNSGRDARRQGLSWRHKRLRTPDWTRICGF